MHAHKETKNELEMSCWSCWQTLASDNTIRIKTKLTVNTGVMQLLWEPTVRCVCVCVCVCVVRERRYVCVDPQRGLQLQLVRK